MRLLGSARRARSSERPRRDRRWRRWVLRILSGLVALIVLVAVALEVLVCSLNQPWLKGRLLELARTSAGVEIDYRTARIALSSGAEVEGLIVRSPVAVRAVAPELVRVSRAEARWSLGTVLWGHGPLIDRIALSDDTLTT